jgi:dihydrofolate reductase
MLLPCSVIGTCSKFEGKVQETNHKFEIREKLQETNHKLQIRNPKEAPNSKSQITISKSEKSSRRQITKPILEFGICNLELVTRNPQLLTHGDKQTTKMPPFTLILHMVTSLDGIIAKPDNSVSWFETADHYENGLELTLEETKSFLTNIDCYVMGSHTYEHAIKLSESYGWAYGDTPTLVLSHRSLKIDRPNIQLFSGELKRVVEEELKPKYRNAWVVGGASLTRDFIQLGLADEIRLTVLPVLLGEGLRFCNHLAGDRPLHLAEVKAYKSGAVELRYEIKK